MTKPTITLYTDGACDLNDTNEPGGWAAILVATDTQGNVLKEQELSGGEKHTTNNRMEMTAIIEGLQALTRPTSLTVITDSQYVIKTMEGKQKRHKNRDLWVKLDDLADKHDITWQFVRGHSGHEYNERCDQLAVAERLNHADKHKPIPQKMDLTVSLSDEKVTIFAVGKHDNKDKSGGWGFITVDNEGNETLQTGSVTEDTPQRVQMNAIIEGLKQFDEPQEIEFVLNNENLCKGASEWIHYWVHHNWKGKTKKPVKHQDLWEQIYELSKPHTIAWKWEKQSKDHPIFERLSKSATLARKRHEADE